MLYATVLTWNGRMDMGDDRQVTINRMGRTSLGVLGSMPLRAVAAESGLTPARALLDQQQVRFTQRLLARPRSQQRP